MAGRGRRDGRAHRFSASKASIPHVWALFSSFTSGAWPLAVGLAHLAKGDLGPCEDDGLGEVLKHEAQRRCDVRHRVRAGQDQEAVVSAIVPLHVRGDALPPLLPHLGRVQQRVILDEVKPASGKRSERPG